MKTPLLFIFLCLSSMVFAQKGAKVLISVDMEGISGVVNGEQLGPSGFEYSRFRQFMTDEALAAIRGAKEAGATEIVVADAHGNGLNLLIDQFPQDVRIIRSWPRKYGMVAGIDESFDAVMLIGYHSSTSNMEGVRAHTFSSAKLTDVKINGESVSEGMWAALVTGHFNVPIILISGDDIATKELSDFLNGNVEMAVVKTALGFHSANTLTPAAGAKVVYEASKKALANIKSYRSMSATLPVTCEVSFKNYRVTEVLAYLPMFERINSHTIRFTGKDMTEIADIFVFLMEYESGIEP